MLSLHRDKVEVPDKERHQIFLEPEGPTHTNISDSTTFPEVQYEPKTIDDFRVNHEPATPEYDFVDPVQLNRLRNEARR
jgi:tRNA U34 5-carboxymethylaminomethyl modifying enzyme MnmG/GidA